MSASSSDAHWSLATRVAFRFAFVFLGLCYFPFPLDLIPFIANAWLKLWNALIVFTGRVVFGVKVDTVFNGSGDRTYDWIQVFVIALAAVVATIVWSIVDRKRPSYPTLFRWYHVYIRFSLASAMIAYGAFKVIPSQFSAPSLERLMQPFGDASPMGLLWTFMGASAPYTIFTGIGELTGGLLLTNRRTALLGALICSAVMTHVVMLNFAYDVPVKIYASVLLCTALAIAAPDAHRLLRFFVLDRPSESLFADRRLRIAACVAVVAFVVYSLQSTLRQSWKQRQMLAGFVTTSPLSGTWDVDDLTMDGVAHPPLTTDLTRWRRLVVTGKQSLTMQKMDDSRLRYFLTLDEKAKTLTLKRRADPKFLATLTYAKPDGVDTRTAAAARCIRRKEDRGDAAQGSRQNVHVDDARVSLGERSALQPVVAVNERVFLKIGRRHAEARDEAAGLRAWNGNGAVRLIDEWLDGDSYALLLERCEPGTQLRDALPEVEQDEVIAALLQRLWIEPPKNHAFRPLSEMCDAWADECDDRSDAFVRDAIAVWRDLARYADRSVLLATDLHAGNVLAAQREPWLAIDPKPYVGDPAYDVLQHMLNCPARLAEDPGRLCDRMAALAGVNASRVRQWMFARLVVEGPANYDVARRLAP